MVLMAADDSDHHHPKDKPAPAPAPASTSPSPVPAPAKRTRLHNFTFPTLSWGSHRFLRCSKDGAPASSFTPPPQKEKPQQGAAAGGGESQTPRPWNLRTRRSDAAAPRSDAAGKAQKPLASPAADARKRGFSITLTKEEIAEDFLAIRGARPPRRPKKRPRAVQRQVDALYPGLSLADVTPDSYKIEER